MIVYELVIDYGNAKTVFYKNVLYGPYESKIIIEQIGQFLENGWFS